MPVELPQDLSMLNDEYLNKFSLEVKAEADELSAGDSLEAPETVEALELLATQYSALKAEKNRRSDAVAELADKKKRIADAFAEDETVEDEPEVVDETAANEPVVEDKEEDMSSKTPEDQALADLEDSIDPGDETPEVELGDLTDGASAPKKSAAQKIDAMNSNAPATRGKEQLATTPAIKINESTLVAAPGVKGFGAGESMDFDQLADAATQVINGSSNIRTDGDGIVLAHQTIANDADLRLTKNENENFGIIQEVIEGTLEAHAGSNGMVASGAPCLPTKVDYSFFRLAKVQRPVEQNLPRVSTPEGQIRFISPVDWAYLSQGITVKTCVDEGAVPYVDKSVVKVDCPNTRECCVSSVSRILEFNNLTFRAFRQFTREAIYQLGVAFAAAKEVMYLDDIEAGSTLVNPNALQYGATRDIFSTLATAAYGYRKRHHMNMDAPLTVMVHDSIKYIKAIDMFNDGRLSFGRDPEGTMRAYFSKLGVNLVYTYHLSSNATAVNGTGLYGPQAAGADLNALPTQICAYMFSPGTFIRMDAGQLDLGLVRDSVLNRQNDLHLFAEQWTKVCKVGYESVKIPLAVCPNGAGAGDIEPYTC